MVEEESKSVDATNFTLRGTMLEALLTTGIGVQRKTTEVSEETLGMLQLLQGTLITKANLDRMLVTNEKLLVAMVRQLVDVDMIRPATKLMKDVTSEEGRAALPWKTIMTQFTHEKVPNWWRPYTLGCLDKKGHTRLDVAIKNGDEEKALSFLTSPWGAFGCRRIRRDGRTALMGAIEKKMKTVCMKMLELFGADGCNAGSVETMRGETALIRSCRFGLEDVALELLEFGADACKVDHINNKGATALMGAIEKKMKTVCMKMLELFGADGCNAGSVETMRGETALIRSCRFGLEDVALELLEFGDDACRLNHVDNEGVTAFMHACRSRLEAPALDMLAFGVDACKLNHANESGDTPLIVACMFELNSVALKMLEFGADVCKLNNVGDDGHTALISACLMGLDQVVLEMLEFGAAACKLNHVDEEGRTALITACMSSQDAVALKVLEFGAEACKLNHADEMGKTALHHACNMRLGSVCLQILNFGADACNLNHRTLYGHTALYFAKRRGLRNVVEAIRLLQQDRTV